jgi:phospholipid transport system transporter-binding protein
VARREGNRLFLEGAVTAGTVPTLLDEGAAELRNGVEIVDFAAVTDLDSAALALALAWLREARAAGRAIRFANLPPAMENLARLYAIDEFLPVVRGEQ